MQIKQKPKSEGGITLIALIIMIVLVIILAAISLRGITGKERNIGFVYTNSPNLCNRAVQRASI